MITIEDSISKLSNVGPSLSRRFASVGINSIKDLLLFFPYKHLDFSNFSSIKNISPGITVTIKVKVKSIQSRFNFKTKRSLCEAVVSDSTGSVKVTWFNQGYIAQTLKPGDEIFISGKYQLYKGLQILNPVYEKISSENIHTGRLVPQYHLTKGLYAKTVRTILHSCLNFAKDLQDTLPKKVRNKYSLPSLTETVLEMHFPKSLELLQSAQKRLIFEEAFTQQLAAVLHKQTRKEHSAPKIFANIVLIKAFIKKLPFQLTIGQKQALWDILQDMEKQSPMNRLLEGDVGSGKTLVAVAASLNCGESGYQTILLAPTEILAKQHFESFAKFSKSCALLTGGFAIHNNKKIPKSKLVEAIAKGKVLHIVGTHALLQENIEFKKLGLVVIDEQHRFGVSQRAKIPKLKSKISQQFPHLLSMTATPIPRTLALSIFGDLSISLLTELPSNRQSITTKIIPEMSRDSVYEKIRQEVKTGRQVFIVTSRVESSESEEEDSEKNQAKAAKSEFLKLSKNIFPEFQLGLLYGGLKSKEKDEVMNSFAEKKLDILVASSVIEIGIDIPNATIIVIEGAQNFGLAQLHQLRGRVGRGNFPSYCFLFTDTLEEPTMERLNFFASCNNGFLLAQKDLEQRGFGSLFGEQQTGFNFRFGKFLTIKILKTARVAAEEFIKEDPHLENNKMLKAIVSPLLEQIHLE